jgi:hypothetical protein
MAFLITTTNSITLDDLGDRVLASGLVNYDLESEFGIEDIRYSVSLATAINNGDVTGVDDLGRVFNAKGSLAATKAWLRTAFHAETTDHLPEGSTNHYYTDSRMRSAITIAPSSAQYLGFDQSTGELTIKALAITDVITDSSGATSLAQFITNYGYTAVGKQIQSGDVVILPNGSIDGSVTYIHNGGTTGTVTDFQLIESPNLSVSSIRGNFSATSPLSYDQGTGVFSVQQATTGTNGYLSSTDWNVFNSKQDTITLDNLSTTTTGISITGTGHVVGGALAINIGTANGISDGLLSSTDWMTFSGKQNTLTFGNINSLTLSVTGGSGAVIGSGVMIEAATANASTTGLLSSADWNTFNNKANVSSIPTTGTGSITASTNSEITITGGNNSVFGPGVNISISTASASSNGLLSSTDWNTFNDKQDYLNTGNLTTTTSGITITGGTNAVVGTGATVDIATASGSQNGLLSSTDWTTFNNKANVSSIPTTGTGSITTTSTGVTVMGGTNAVFGSGVSIDIVQADASTTGLLKNADWTAFNDKQDALTFSNGLTNAAGAVTIGGIFTSDINLTSTNASSFTIGTSSKKIGTFNVYANGIYLIDSALHAYININNSVEIGSEAHFAGDYSANYTDRSLVDKAWVVGAISSATPTAHDLTTTTSAITITGGTGAVLGSGATIDIATASGTTTGLLSSVDWSTFSQKQNSLSYNNLNGDVSGYISVTNGTGAIAGMAHGDVSLNLITGNLTTTTTGVTIGVNGKVVGADISINIATASSSDTGLLSSADWNTFNNKANVSSIPTTGTGSITASTNSEITITGGNNSVFGPGVNISISTASASSNGLLSSTDWNTFNDKQDYLNTGNLTTTTSGITITGGTNAVVGTGATVDIATASGSQNGLLSSTDWTTFNGKPSELKKTYAFTAAVNSGNTSNRYANGAGSVPTNSSPFVVPFAGFITGVSLNTSVASVWTAEIYVNGSLVTSLASSGSKSVFTNALNIAITAGAQISMRINGTGVNYPSISVFVSE